MRNAHVHWKLTVLNSLVALAAPPGCVNLTSPWTGGRATVARDTGVAEPEDGSSTSTGIADALREDRVPDPTAMPDSSAGSGGSHGTLATSGVAVSDALPDNSMGSGGSHGTLATGGVTATGGMGGGGSSGAPDSGVDLTLPAPLPCKDWVLHGIGVPAGTLATASSINADHVPADAIDGDSTTAWAAMGAQAWLLLRFPTPIAVTGIRLMCSGAMAHTSEGYTIAAGTSDIGLSTIGSASRQFEGASAILDAIPVTSGVYSDIKITIVTIDAVGLWNIRIDELSILTPECP